MTVVIVPPCQEPCCRVARGETPYPETPEQAGRRIGRALVDSIRFGPRGYTLATPMTPKRPRRHAHDPR